MKKELENFNRFKHYIGRYTNVKKEEIDHRSACGIFMCDPIKQMTEDAADVLYQKGIIESDQVTRLLFHAAKIRIEYLKKKCISAPRNILAATFLYMAGVWNRQVYKRFTQEVIATVFFTTTNAIRKYGQSVMKTIDLKELNIPGATGMKECNSRPGFDTHGFANSKIDNEHSCVYCSNKATFQVNIQPKPFGKRLFVCNIHKQALMKSMPTLERLGVSFKKLC